MNWQQLDPAVCPSEVVESEESSGGTFTSEVLVQILLPIVLILAFFSAASLHQKDAGQEKEKENGEKLARMYLELQQQRIIAALENTESAWKRELGAFYLSGVNVQIDSMGQIVTQDMTLASSCKTIADVFGSDTSRSSVADQLFARVLQSAGLTDGEQSSTAVDPLEAHVSALTPSNREFLRERITKFLSSTQADIVSDQGRLIDSVFNQYRDLPLDNRYQLFPESLEIKQQITTSTSEGKDTTALADALALAFHRKARKDFEDRGYRLLEESWSGR